MLNKDNILNVLEANKVVLTGHFKLSSGLHSERYIQCAKIFENPMLSMQIIEILVQNISQNIERKNFDTILSPAMGGVLCGYEVARQMLCKNIFVERVDNVFTLKRGFSVKKGERILLIEDVVTTGKSTLEACKVIEELGAKVVGMASIIDRREKDNNSLPFALTSVLKLNVPTYKTENLPDHLKNIPWVKPGSRVQN
jgi:orotate phosphoribosyltransferase